ncbi:hypothetical protein [Chishuiella changwenlii]|uniref:hypothetical protein n=1 Tax=Chishuiella changwenlii TaxID=1434701 RepID=UPI002FDA3292
MKLKLSFWALLLLPISIFSQVGINTNTPTKSLDINGETRIRQIDDLPIKPNYVLVPDTDGTVKKALSSSIGTDPQYSPKLAGIFRLNNDFTCSTCERRIIPFNENVVVNNEYIQVVSNGVYNVVDPGLYQFTLQVGTNGVTVGQDIIIGIVNTAGNWIGRATFSYANTARQYKVFTATLQLNAGHRFSMAINAASGSVQGLQTGTTGTGSLTNFSVVKY